MTESSTATGIDVGYEVFSRHRWAALARRPGTALSDSDARRLVATGESISLPEVDDVYRPLSELLALMAAAKRSEQRSRAGFLGESATHVPFIIGIAGGVAVGKSTTARVLQALLREGDGHPVVDLLTTDGFLYPNAALEARGLMARKGFPGEL